MQKLKEVRIEWLYVLKKKIFIFLFLLIILSMVLSAFFLRNALLEDSKNKTHELAVAIQSSLKNLMLVRNADLIQGALDDIMAGSESIQKAFILDQDGRIAYSSNEEETGKSLDRFTEESCRGCHQSVGMPPTASTIMIKEKNVSLHRNITVIFNEEKCYGCHAKENRINGKLIIDRSLKETYSLVFLLEAFIVGTGIVFILFLFIFLSKGFDKYIGEIIRQHTELNLLYTLVGRLSNSIKVEELKEIIVEILSEALDASEVAIVLPSTNMDYKVTGWTAEERKTRRKKVEKGDPLMEVINNWQDGSLTEEVISEDNKEIFMPIIKDSARLALIVIKRRDQAFDSGKLFLMKAISSHISVALDNARLYNIAITDELTGLYTIRHLRAHVEKMFSDFMEYGEKFTFLMLDIDDFKKINDVYGHMVGDSVLKDIARCIIDSVKQTDMAFRYGGEEFSVLLPASDIKDGKHVAERIRSRIEDAVFEKGVHDLKLTISIGVSNCPVNAKTVSDLISKADKALYDAKSSGKNRIVLSNS